MLPYEHVAYGFLVSLLLFIFTNVGLLGSFIIFMMSWCIDVDHYLFYVIKKKDWNLKRAYQYYEAQLSIYQKQKEHYDAPLCIFHTAEFVIVLIVLAFYSKIALFVLMGTVLHYVGDAYHTFYVLKMPRIRRYTVYRYLKEKLS
jgi:hypothetical protein